PSTVARRSSSTCAYSRSVLRVNCTRVCSTACPAAEAGSPPSSATFSISTRSPKRACRSSRAAKLARARLSSSPGFGGLRLARHPERAQPVQRDGGRAASALAEDEPGLAGRQIHHRALRGIELHVDRRRRTGALPVRSRQEPGKRGRRLREPLAAAADQRAA